MTSNGKEGIDDHAQLGPTPQDQAIVGAGNENQELGELTTTHREEEEEDIQEGHDGKDMPVRVYSEDKGGEVDEEEVVYPRRGSTEELGALNIKDTSDAPLIDFEDEQPQEDSSIQRVANKTEGESNELDQPHILSEGDNTGINAQDQGHSPALIDLNLSEDLPGIPDVKLTAHNPVDPVPVPPEEGGRDECVNESEATAPQEQTLERLDAEGNVAPVEDGQGSPDLLAQLAKDDEHKVDEGEKQVASRGDEDGLNEEPSSQTTQDAHLAQPSATTGDESHTKAKEEDPSTSLHAEEAVNPNNEPALEVASEAIQAETALATNDELRHEDEGNPAEPRDVEGSEIPAHVHGDAQSVEKDPDNVPECDSAAEAAGEDDTVSVSQIEGGDNPVNLGPQDQSTVIEPALPHEESQASVPVIDGKDATDREEIFSDSKHTDADVNENVEGTGPSDLAKEVNADPPSVQQEQDHVSHAPTDDAIQNTEAPRIEILNIQGPAGTHPDPVPEYSTESLESTARDVEPAIQAEDEMQPQPTGQPLGSESLASPSDPIHPHNENTDGDQLTKVTSEVPAEVELGTSKEELSSETHPTADAKDSEADVPAQAEEGQLAPPPAEAIQEPFPVAADAIAAAQMQESDPKTDEPTPQDIADITAATEPVGIVDTGKLVEGEIPLKSNEAPSQPTEENLHQEDDQPIDVELHDSFALSVPPQEAVDDSSATELVPPVSEVPFEAYSASDDVQPSSGALPREIEQKQLEASGTLIDTKTVQEIPSPLVKPSHGVSSGDASAGDAQDAQNIEPLESQGEMLNLTETLPPTEAVAEDLALTSTSDPIPPQNENADGDQVANLASEVPAQIEQETSTEENPSVIHSAADAKDPEVDVPAHVEEEQLAPPPVVATQEPFPDAADAIASAQMQESDSKAGEPAPRDAAKIAAITESVDGVDAIKSVEGEIPLKSNEASSQPIEEDLHQEGDQPVDAELHESLSAPLQGAADDSSATEPVPPVSEVPTEAYPAPDDAQSFSGISPRVIEPKRVEASDALIDTKTAREIPSPLVKPSLDGSSGDSSAGVMQVPLNTEPLESQGNMQNLADTLPPTEAVAEELVEAERGQTEVLHEPVESDSKNAFAAVNGDGQVAEPAEAVSETNRPPLSHANEPEASQQLLDAEPEITESQVEASEDKNTIGIYHDASHDGVKGMAEPGIAQQGENSKAELTPLMMGASPKVEGGFNEPTAISAASEVPIEESKSTAEDDGATINAGETTHEESVDMIQRGHAATVSTEHQLQTSASHPQGMESAEEVETVPSTETKAEDLASIPEPAESSPVEVRGKGAEGLVPTQANTGIFKEEVSQSIISQNEEDRANSGQESPSNEVADEGRPDKLTKSLEPSEDVNRGDPTLENLHESTQDGHESWDESQPAKEVTSNAQFVKNVGDHGMTADINEPKAEQVPSKSEFDFAPSFEENSPAQEQRDSNIPHSTSGNNFASVRTEDGPDHSTSAFGAGPGSGLLDHGAEWTMPAMSPSDRTRRPEAVGDEASSLQSFKDGEIGGLPASDSVIRPGDEAPSIQDAANIGIRVEPATPAAVDDDDDDDQLGEPSEDVSDDLDERGEINGVGLDYNAEPITPKVGALQHLNGETHPEGEGTIGIQRSPLTRPNLQVHDANTDIDTSFISVVSEAPSSPRSNLGINSPTFDSRSEISVASRLPEPPQSPRIDPLNSIEVAESVRSMESETVPPKNGWNHKTPTEEQPTFTLSPPEASENIGTGSETGQLSSNGQESKTPVVRHQEPAEDPTRLDLSVPQQPEKSDELLSSVAEQQPSPVPSMTPDLEHGKDAQHPEVSVPPGPLTDTFASQEREDEEQSDGEINDALEKVTSQEVFQFPPAAEESDEVPTSAAAPAELGLSEKLTPAPQGAVIPLPDEPAMVQPVIEQEDEKPGVAEDATNAENTATRVDDPSNMAAYSIPSNAALEPAPQVIAEMAEKSDEQNPGQDYSVQVKQEEEIKASDLPAGTSAGGEPGTRDEAHVQSTDRSHVENEADAMDLMADANKNQPHQTLSSIDHPDTSEDVAAVTEEVKIHTSEPENTSALAPAVDQTSITSPTSKKASVEGVKEELIAKPAVDTREAAASEEEDAHPTSEDLAQIHETTDIPTAPQAATESKEVTETTTSPSIANENAEDSARGHLDSATTELKPRSPTRKETISTVNIQSTTEKEIRPRIDTSKQVQFPTSFPTIREPQEGDDREGNPEARTQLDGTEDRDFLETPKDRMRHFSTTSRILPGGWSFPLHSQGKPSLEMAAGEFVPLPPRSPKEKESKCVVM